MFCRIALTADPVPTADGQDEAVAGPSRPPTADAWQLDFCSRPILDERGKKLWELLICDDTRSFEYSRYFPNNKINSTQVHSAECFRNWRNSWSAVGAKLQAAIDCASYAFDVRRAS